MIKFNTILPSKHTLPFMFSDQNITCISHSSYDSPHAPERHGRMVNAPTSYSGGPGFKALPRRPVMLIEVFVIFLSLSRRMPA